MHITEALIRRFLSGEDCTPEEADLVSKYFMENPDRLNDYVGEEWDDADNSTPLPFDHTREMLANISDQAFGRPADKRIGRRYLIGWAAAALVIMIAGVGLLRISRKTKSATAIAATTKDTTRKEPGSGWQVRVNQTRNREKIVMPDRSVVTLFATGRITYKEAFAPDKREVFLEGQASFDVSKDLSRPFIVQAGRVTTTVLGTSFNILQSGQRVTVKLYNGKVSVRAAKRDIILAPGQEMQYSEGNDLAEVIPIREEPVEDTGKPGMEEHSYVATLVFDNAPLPEVMEKLIRRYHTPIVYDRNSLGKMFFTGSVLRSDSLLTILRVIGNMNGLTISPHENGFAVTASPN